MGLLPSGKFKNFKFENFVRLGDPPNSFKLLYQKFAVAAGTDFLEEAELQKF